MGFPFSATSCWVYSMYMAYRDIGGMLLNFMLCEELRPLYIFDVTNVPKKPEWDMDIPEGW